MCVCVLRILLVQNEVWWSMFLVSEFLCFKFCRLSEECHRILQEKAHNY